MGKRVEPFLALVAAVHLVSCMQEKLVTPEERLIPVQIDLQFGFGGQQVVIDLDRVEYFRTILVGESLAGPGASFLVQLSRGAHRLQVTWSAGHSSVHQQSSEIVVGEAPQYYVGLSLFDDSLHVRVQERPFRYASIGSESQCWLEDVTGGDGLSSRGAVGIGSDGSGDGFDEAILLPGKERDLTVQCLVLSRGNGYAGSQEALPVRDLSEQLVSQNAPTAG